ncbi:MAG: putative transglutaminase-like cysteine proteinase [Halieaceae bacterium]|jgi:predicted transglutaminase-like cysteine proteinase
MERVWALIKRYMLHCSATLVTVLVACTLALAVPDLDKMQNIALTRYGQDAANTVAEWRAMIDKIQPWTDEQKAVAINDYFNTQIRWVQDQEAWGQNDYWATPLQTMARRMGDCEDFSIAKYASLILAGVNVNKLRITYVKARMGGPYSKISEAHMVLAYYSTPSADPKILDNLIMDVRPASQRSDLTPVYGFNSNGLWVGGALAPATKDPSAKLSRWRDLLQRAAAEGLG